MRVRVPRILLLSGCLVWLAGCAATKTAESPSSDPQATGSIEAAPIGAVGPNDVTGQTAGLLGDDPKDDLSLGKKYFRDNSFGLAEKHFRQAVEHGPKDVEAWIGLAASYDRLKRFDLADRAYKQATALVGPTPEIMNNQGYSYLLRGDHRRARKTLLAAQMKDPANPFIKNNLDLLDESFAKAKAIQ
jgi:Flp pilus assembly protein TadD